MIKSKKNSVIVLIVAGGVGVRSGGDVPKQYQMIGNDTVLNHNIKNFINNNEIDHVRVVINKNAENLYLKDKIISDKLDYVFGGKERKDSVRLGLQSLEGLSPEKVLIHDAARPFVSDNLISRILNELNSEEDEVDNKNAVIPVIKMVDTIKQTHQNKIEKTLDREKIVAVQTPQAFTFDLINDFHKRADSENSDVIFTDDASICEYYGEDVFFVDGENENIKITYENDIKHFNNILLEGKPKQMSKFRIGSGFDVHSFCDDGSDSIILGGVEIPHDKGLLGHSDADVVLHSIVDAMLGAVAEGDIGQHFPPSDDKWKDVDSSVFVKYADSIIKKKGAEIENIDVTIICEKPKISEFREKIRENVADILSIEIDKVSIKATTTEKQGFLGRGEAIAAQASILLSL